MIHLDSGAVLQAYMEGDWYVGPSGALYVVPLDDHEPWGPDDPLMDLICRGSAPPSVTPVPTSLRRWSPADGLYHA